MSAPCTHRESDPRGTIDEFPMGLWSVHRQPAPQFAAGGTVKLLLTSGGVTNPSIENALIGLLGKPIAESSALCIPTAQWGHPNPMCGPTGVRILSWAHPRGRWRAWAGSRWACSSYRVAKHRRGAMGSLAARGRCAAGRWRRRDVSVPLDARIWTGGTPAVTFGKGLGRSKRREHGDDAAHRRRLRRLAVRD